MKAFKSLLVASCLAISIYLIYSWAVGAPDVIVESNNISALYNYIKPNEYNKNLLVIFDIDNTLAKMPTSLGSDQWFYATHNALVQQGLSHQKAIDLIIPELLHIHRNTWMIPIEENTVSVINDLQKRGISVIALTARSLDLAHRTIEQLHRMGIVFTKTDPHECPIKYGEGKPGLYIDGIIFSGNYNKGEMLVNWFKQIKYRPTKIIFIDDKLKNLHAVEKALHDRNYPFIGIRYGAMDQEVKDFTLQSIEKEKREFYDKYPFEIPVVAPALAP